MGTVNVLNQLPEYDFNAPIDVETIFEDSDDDDPSFQNAPSEQENVMDNNNNKQDHVGKWETKSKKNNKSSENQINHRSLNKSMLSMNRNNRILQKKPIKEISKDNENNNSMLTEVGQYHYQNKSNANQHAIALIGDDTVNNEGNLPSTRQMNDRHEPVTTFIEDLLNKLSDHIVLIMQSFYHYGVKRTNQDNKKREEIFHFIKHHFFELSYSTMEAIFLPQERNKSFINQFLDNTVLIANSKSLQWKCHRGHVLPFFKELVTWTKLKRDHIKNNQQLRPPNENILLKQQLTRPLLPLNLPQSEIVADSNIATQKTQNNLCIFTSGTPGNEVSINIDADTLLQITEKQQCLTSERNGNHNNYTPDSKSTRRKTPVARPINGNRVENIQKNNSHYDRPPPPYNMNHCSSIIPHRPQQYNRINVNPIQNNYNIRQPIHTYRTQVQYINTNQTSPSYNNSSNYSLYDNIDNTNNNIHMHGTQIENQVTSRPVIMNVASWDPNTRILNVRCYMCGRRTSTPCGPYNTSRRPIYCSYLCKELDSQFYKPPRNNE